MVGKWKNAKHNSDKAKMLFHENIKRERTARQSAYKSAWCGKGA
jgi:hypothetical protein